MRLQYSIIFNIIKNNILFVFVFFAGLLLIVGLIYYICLNPKRKLVNKIIEKYKMDGYSIPYYVAERHCTWNNMRAFFFGLEYMFTLLSIVASLMTVFYASNTVNDTQNNSQNAYIIFLALLSTCFTVAGIFTRPGRTAFMAQHTWRELDVCIIQTISDKSLSKDEKDKIVINKIVEMEKYIETFER